MLLANCSVAEAALRAFPGCALLRRHPTPPPRQFDPLLRAAAAAGVSIDISTSKVCGRREAGRVGAVCVYVWVNTLCACCPSILLRRACSQSLAESLDAAVRADDPYFNTLLRIMATRCMTQALYFSAGE